MNTNSRILIIDDENGLRNGVKKLLEEEGFNVDSAAMGNEGIKLGRSNEYDVAIIDLKMPDVDGLQVLKEIKKVHPNTVCFISTAYASYENAIDSIKFGAYGYIPKPFTSQELLEKLEEGLVKRKLLVDSEKWKKEREEKLLEVAFEKTRLNTIINSMQEGVLVVNKTGQVVLFNPCTLKLLKIDKIKIEDFAADIIPGDLTELIVNVFRSSGSKTYSKVLNINDELIVEAMASPVPHPNGSLAGVVVVLKDMTELKKIENIKSQFVSMVSHELKAPVAAVYGFLQLLSDNSINLTEEQRINFISRSKIRLDGLLKLVNDLLDISRMEMKVVQRELKDFDLSASIKYVLETLQNEMNQKQIQLGLNFQNNLPLFKCDEDEMNRVFTNLLSNAIKYNKVTGTILISISSTTNHIIVEVKDTGIGLNSNDKAKLFQEFFRAKNENTKNISGTGLGLSIVKRIVDSYSGKIEVESEYGKGTSFKIYFPLR
ncbi:MAG TPA: ATP-binding protein [Ignavibacteriaceae bacterium]|nr:ATP-binding protein [Ignavibacteriaceae bacterium]